MNKLCTDLINNVSEFCPETVTAMLAIDAANHIDELEKVLNFIKRGIEANHIKCAPYFDFDPEATSLEFKSVLDLINETLGSQS